MSGHPPYPPSDPQQQQPGVGGYGVQQSPYGVAGAPGAGQPVMQQPVIMNPAAAGTSPMQGQLFSSTKALLKIQHKRYLEN